MKVEKKKTIKKVDLYGIVSLVCLLVLFLGLYQGVNYRLSYEVRTYCLVLTLLVIEITRYFYGKYKEEQRNENNKKKRNI